MLLEIEKIAYKYCPTVTFIRKNLKLQYYIRPGIRCCRVPTDSFDIGYDISVYRDFDLDRDDMICFKYKHNFTSKLNTEKPNKCANCNTRFEFTLIFCKKCWKSKTAKDAYKLIDDCIKALKANDIAYQKFMNQSVSIPKKIKCKVHIHETAFSADEWGGEWADEDETHYTQQEFSLVV